MVSVPLVVIGLPDTLMPVPAVAATLVTVPPASATKLTLVPSLCRFFPAAPTWLGSKEFKVWSPVLLPEIEEVPVTARVGVEEPETTTEFTEDGVIAPSVRLIAGVVVDVATDPLTPLAVVTLTEVTLPTPAATHEVVEPFVDRTLPELPD